MLAKSNTLQAIRDLEKFLTSFELSFEVESPEPAPKAHAFKMEDPGARYLLHLKLPKAFRLGHFPSLGSSYSILVISI